MLNVFLLHTKELLRNRFLIISGVLIPLILYPLIYFGIVQFFTIKAGLMDNRTNQLYLERTVPHYADFADSLKTINKLELITSKPSESTVKIRVEMVDSLPKFTLLLDSTNSSHLALSSKITRKIDNFFDKELKNKIGSYSRPKDYYRGFVFEAVNVSDKNQMMSKLLSLIVPMFAIISILGVAASVAVEVTAGERENNAAETILVTPLSRAKIIWGKILVVTTFSMLGGLINFVALGAVILQIIEFFSKKAEKFLKFNLDLSGLLNFKILLLIFVTILIISFLGAIVFCAMSVFAKTRKEANIMLSPVSTVLMFASYVIFIPGLENHFLMPYLPIINISMALKMAIAGSFNTIFVIKAVGSSLIYLVLAFKYLLPVMSSEDILFSSNELTLWKKLKMDRKKWKQS